MPLFLWLQHYDYFRILSSICLSFPFSQLLSSGQFSPTISLWLVFSLSFKVCLEKSSPYQLSRLLETGYSSLRLFSQTCFQGCSIIVPAHHSHCSFLGLGCSWIFSLVFNSSSSSVWLLLDYPGFLLLHFKVSTSACFPYKGVIGALVSKSRWPLGINWVGSSNSSVYL